MADSDEDFEFSEDEEDESSDAIATSHRAALAEFYKIPRPAAEDEAPIDAPGFDADDHVRRLLRERNLQELLETDDHLCHEIKTLDSDMQMLVYEVRDPPKLTAKEPSVAASRRWCASTSSPSRSLSLSRARSSPHAQELQQVHLRDRHDSQNEDQRREHGERDAGPRE